MGVYTGRCDGELTLDQAIDHAMLKSAGGGDCAREHSYLAGWLRELRWLRELTPITGAVNMLLTHGPDGDLGKLALRSMQVVMNQFGRSVDAKAMPADDFYVDDDTIGKQQAVETVLKSRHQIGAFFEDEVISNLAEDIVSALDELDKQDVLVLSPENELQKTKILQQRCDEFEAALREMVGREVGEVDRYIEKLIEWQRDEKGQPDCPSEE